MTNDERLEAIERLAARVDYLEKLAAAAMAFIIVLIITAVIVFFVFVTR